MSSRSFYTENSFARKHLEKHGWTEGSGLGAREHGINEAIRVKIKKDNTGVGHDPAKEFTDHWWNAVFNKAAASITVEMGEDGVVVKTKEKKKKEQTSDARKKLYSNFIKGSLLNNGTETMVEKRENDDSSDDDEHPNTTLPDAELFRICGGLTAHKAARHGLNLNGKLSRVQEQDKLLLEKFKQRTDNYRQGSEVTAKAPKEGCSHDGVTSTDQSPRKNKKKNKERSESDTNDATLGLAIADGGQNLITGFNRILAGDSDHTRKRKKSKSKNEPSDAVCSCEMAAAERGDDKISTSCKAERKKKKKREKIDKELDIGREKDDSTLSCQLALKETCSVADNDTFHKKKNKKKRKKEKNGDQIRSGTEEGTSSYEFGTEALAYCDQNTTKRRRVYEDVCTDDAAASRNSSVVVNPCVTSEKKKKERKNRRESEEPE